MSFDKFDNKIKEVAEHHHPAYDEKAWAKMEKLLDKHLPVDDNRRRRIIFFILFFILLGGGAIFISGLFNQKKNESKNVVVTVQVPNARKEKSNEMQTKQTKGNDKTITGEQVENDSDINAIDFREEKRSNTVISKTNKTNEYKSFRQPGKTREKEVEKIVTNSSEKPGLKSKVVNKYNVKKGSPERKEEINEEINDNHVKPSAGNMGSIVTGSNNDPKKNDSISGSNKTENALTKKPQIQDSSIEGGAKSASSSIKRKSKKRSSLFFSFSTGPDISYARTEKAGKLKPVFGIGAGLNLGDKFTIRTGFYTGRKVYSASPTAYNPPASFYIYYPYLENVDADCKVYEIPLLFSYNFKQTDRVSWFASAGLLSYLMKKETYNYTYKYTPSGQSLKKEWTTKNENNHFFSILTLSGGYQRQVGKSVFIMVEPYVKLPLTGVGYGKVKLNSAGILFSIGITPFNDKKK